MSATDYAELVGFNTDWRDTWWNQDYLEMVGRRLGLEHVESMLDVGCGAGHWGQRLSTLLRSGARVVGLDHEAGFLEVARERAMGRPHHFEYLASTADMLPFPDDHFDLVTCQTVLMHVADPASVVAEMIRVTKPGGLVLASEPNNLADPLSNRIATPGLAPDVLARLFAFEVICTRGRVIMGHGDCVIGERVPKLFARRGLQGIQVASNDTCSTMLPPYDTPEERMTLELIRAWFAKQRVGFGERALVRQMYRFGDGDDASFDTLYELTLETQRAMIDAIDAGELWTAGGFFLYLISGRKPVFNNPSQIGRLAQ